MEVTIELVQQLRQYADVSFTDAKLALEATNGDLLEALVWLEKNGKIDLAGVGSYNTSASGGGKEAALPECRPESIWCRLWRFLTENRLECSREESRFEVPLAALIALVLFAFYVVVIGLLLGFCFGWRFHFAGPELGNRKVNDVMDTIDDAAEGIVRQVKDSWKK